MHLIIFFILQAYLFFLYICLILSMFFQITAFLPYHVLVREMYSTEHVVWVSFEIESESFIVFFEMLQGAEFGEQIPTLPIDVKQFLLCVRQSPNPPWAQLVRRGEIPSNGATD